jgi:hypothetical protein
MENPATWTPTQKIIDAALYGANDTNVLSNRIVKSLKDNHLLKGGIDDLYISIIIDWVIIEDDMNNKLPVEEMIIGYSLTTLIYNELKKNNILK